jgi:hypothetical protein
MTRLKQWQPSPSNDEVELNDAFKKGAIPVKVQSKGKPYCFLE